MRAPRHGHAPHLDLDLDLDLGDMVEMLPRNAHSDAHPAQPAAHRFADIHDRYAITGRYDSAGHVTGGGTEQGPRVRSASTTSQQSTTSQSSRELFDTAAAAAAWLGTAGLSPAALPAAATRSGWQDPAAAAAAASTAYHRNPLFDPDALNAASAAVQYGEAPPPV